MADRPFTFDVLPAADGEVVLRVTGEIDVAAEAAFSGSLQEAMEREAHRLVIDVTGVEFLASTGLNVLVRASRALTNGCTLVVRGARPQIRRVFEITGLDELLEG